MAGVAIRSSRAGRPREGDLIALGIESSAHTFGVGVVSDSKPYILADVRRVHAPREGGILPREAASLFSTVAGESVKEALDRAGLGIRDVDIIAVTLGPGMGPQLRVGATVARALSEHYGKPLVPVNHAVAHVEMARFLTGFADPVILYVSGGNTTVSSHVDGRYRVFGETLDISLGNLQDTFAREAGIAPPYVVGGRHVIDICAEGGEFVEGLPYVVKGQDSSFSGLLTGALRLLRRGASLRDVCYTLREIAYSSTVEVAERAVAHTGKDSIVLTGGVAASEFLNGKVAEMAKLQGIGFKPVPPEFNVDNGVMIALTGILAYRAGITVSPGRAFVRQRWRIDQVEVKWFPSTL